jgi:3-hydroxybutyryl-CoA dehydratase
VESTILSRRMPRAPVVGEKFGFRRTLTEADMTLFIGVTWDVNPYHTDETYARASRFQKRIVPGLLTASMLTHLGGLWAFLATEMKFEFIAPVFIGNTVSAEVEVVEVDETLGWVLLRCRSVNEDNLEVLRAEIKGFPGRFESDD